MLPVLESTFWLQSIPAICMITLPIAIVSNQPIWRSSLTGIVTYLFIAQLAALQLFKFI